MLSWLHWPSLETSSFFFVPLRGFTYLSSTYGTLFEGLSSTSFGGPPVQVYTLLKAFFSIAASHQHVSSPQFGQLSVGRVASIPQ